MGRVIGSGPEEVDGDLFCGEPVVLDCAANAVQHVIAVRLHEHLNSGARHVGHELAHQRLAGRMKVDLGVFDQDHVALGCRESRHHDGQDLSEAEPGMDRTVIVRGVRRA